MHFNYQVVAPSGSLISEHGEANSAKVLAERLEKQGFQIIEIRKDWLKSLSGGGRRVQLKRAALIDLFEHMKGMLELGMNVTTAVASVRETLDDKNLRQALVMVEDLTGKGYSLSDSMHETEMFPDLVVASTSAAEKANRLEHVFGELAEHYRRLDELIRRATRAATYPLISIVVLGAVFTLMLFFVIPQLKDVLPPPLPLITRMMIGLSSVIRYVWWLPIVGVIALIFAYRGLGTARRAQIMHSLYHVPMVGRIGLNLELSTIFMSLAMLNGGGIPLLETLRLVAAGIRSPLLREKLDVCRELAQQGSPLSEGFRDPIFPPVVLRAIIHGETTGRFDKQFAGVAKFLRERTANQLEMISSFIEPALIVVGGGILLLMALSIFLPIYGSIAKMGRS
jgi:type II secretory pathway component PulF